MCIETWTLPSRPRRLVLYALCLQDDGDGGEADFVGIGTTVGTDNEDAKKAGEVKIPTIAEIIAKMKAFGEEIKRMPTRQPVTDDTVHVDTESDEEDVGDDASSANAKEDDVCSGDVVDGECRAV